MKFDGAAFKKLEGLNVGILKFFPMIKVMVHTTDPSPGRGAVFLSPPIIFGFPT